MLSLTLQLLGDLREVGKQVAAAVARAVLEVVHHVCGHHDLLAHHVGKRKHRAVGVQPGQLGSVFVCVCARVCVGGVRLGGWVGSAGSVGGARRPVCAARLWGSAVQCNYSTTHHPGSTTVIPLQYPSKQYPPLQYAPGT